MKIKVLALTLAAWAASSLAASAETVVLVQGYLGSAGSWRGTGVAAVLHGAGWSDGGHLSVAPGGVVQPVPSDPGARRFITVDLPTEAPAVVQSEVLGSYIAAIRQAAGNEPIVLVGHSAGGVVARLFMVRHPDAGVAGLITIAAPHLGTSAAEMGSFIGATPMSWFAPLFGMNTINRSQVLYHDLWRERPSNLLGWLNRVPHPKAKYVSIIRGGDSWVNGYSQDMNMVPALRGGARTVVSPGDHGLRPADGAILADILRALPTS